MASKVTVNWSSLVGLFTHMLFKIITIWGAKALIKGKATLRSLHWNTDSNVCNALSWICKEEIKYVAPVVHKLDSAIGRLNTYPLDSDLSDG